MDRKFLVLLAYPETTIETFLYNYFDNIDFKYIISRDTAQRLMNDKGKIKLKVKDYELDPVELKEKIDKNNYELIIVGAEPLKYLFRRTGITKLSGNKIKDVHKGTGIEFITWCLLDPNIIAIQPNKKNVIEQDINKILTNNITKEIEYIIATNKQEADNILSSLFYSKELAFDTETGSLNPAKKDILGICLTNTVEKGYYIPIDYVNFTLLTNVFDTCENIIGHNIKFDFNKIHHYLPNYFNIENDKLLDKLQDTMILQHLKDENSPKDLKTLALKYTNLGDYENELSVEKKKLAKKYKIKLKEFTYDLFPLEVLGKYGAYDAVATLMIYKKLSRANFYNEDLYKKLVRASIILGYMERNGGVIDKKVFNEYKSEYEYEIAKYKMALQEEIENYDYIEMNFNSPKQISEFLFEIKGYNPIKTTETGAYSTDIEVLDKLYEQYPEDKFIENLVKYRKATKIYSTYISPLENRMIGDKLYSSFNITGTVSGRLSSENPNFQNIPKKMRKIYKGDDEYPLILQADLKNAELHIAGFLANEPYFLDAFRNKEDLHAKMAIALFKLKCAINEVKEKYPEKRQEAKTVNFLILYGGSEFRLANELNIDKKIAKQYIDTFFSAAPNLKKWLAREKQSLLETGYLVTYFGRVRHCPEVKSSKWGVKSHAIRSALNALIQSVASDIILFSLESIVKRLKGKAVLWCSVHDSVVFRIKPKYLNEIKQVVTEEMRAIIPELDPPIGIDFEVGKNWLELKEC